MAGSDTTATSIRAILLAIISNPGIYAKLQREIDTAASGTISSPITDVEARKLPYLQACIMEGLRHFPPTAQLRERVTPPEGAKINDYSIPGGVFIGFNTWGLQLDPIYGPDPEIFRPERWLTEDRERLMEMRRVHELIFGYGNTKCLGAPIAALNLNKVFVEVGSKLDKKYRIELVDHISSC